MGAHAMLTMHSRGLRRPGEVAGGGQRGTRAEHPGGPSLDVRRRDLRAACADAQLHGVDVAEQADDRSAADERRHRAAALRPLRRLPGPGHIDSEDPADDIARRRARDRRRPEHRPGARGAGPARACGVPRADSTPLRSRRAEFVSVLGAISPYDLTADEPTWNLCRALSAAPEPTLSLDQPDNLADPASFASWDAISEFESRPVSAIDRSPAHAGLLSFPSTLLSSARCRWRRPAQHAPAGHADRAWGSRGPKSRSKSSWNAFIAAHCPLRRIVVHAVRSPTPTRYRANVAGERRSRPAGHGRVQARRRGGRASPPGSRGGLAPHGLPDGRQGLSRDRGSPQVAERCRGPLAGGDGGADLRQ